LFALPKKILAMLKNIFFFLIILNSNLYSLTFKSDGSIIKSNGEVIKKSVAEEFQIQITKFQNNEDTDWTLANGSNISGYFGNKIFIKGVPLPKLPKINHFKVKDLALYNGFSSEDDFIIFILNNASKDWFERNKLNEKQIKDALGAIEIEVNKEIDLMKNLQNIIGNSVNNLIKKQIESEIKESASQDSEANDLGGGKDGSPGVRGI
jgi:phosphotransferase system IIB component